jgi:hypothetical protein
MAAVSPIIVIAHQAHFAKECSDPEQAATMPAGLRLGLVVSVRLIDPLLEQPTEDPNAGLQKELAKGVLHLEQRRGQIRQQGVEHYLELFGERLV